MASKAGEEEKKVGTALAVQTGSREVSADLAAELAADAGAGTSQSASDNIVPFIVLLQDMSPEVKKREPEYVDGAEVGMLLNKATKQLYAPDEKSAEQFGIPMLLFQHCFFDQCIVEWVPRIDGGGFVARHEMKGSPEQTIQALGGKQVQDPNDPGKKIWRTSDGKHDLIHTRYHFGHEVRPDGSFAPAVLAFSSTGHTTSREWMTLMNNFKVKTPDGRLVVAPAWSKFYRVTSKPTKNKKGSFFNMAVADAGVIQDANLRAAGKALNASVASGATRADMDNASGTAEDGEVPI